LDIKEFLMEASMAHGVSGFEYMSIKDLVRDYMTVLVDEIHSDVLGNVIGVKRGDGPQPHPKVMLAGHMDEVGMMVTKIEEGGFLRFATSGIDPRVLPGHEVVVHGRRSLTGIVGTKPPHLSSPEESGKPQQAKDLFIDVGLPEHEVRALITVGDVATYKREVTELMGGLMAGKSLDDRAGVAVILVCLDELRKYDFCADVYGVATTQEETGSQGAAASVYAIDPHIGIAIDVCQGDTPGVPEHRTTFVGKGPTMTIGSTIHPKIADGLRKAAREIGVNLQQKVAPAGTGTDAGALHISRQGVATGLISIPQRYMHTSVETLSVKDVEDAGRVLARFIAACDWGFVEGLNEWN
jgi:endoglucanase